MYCTNEIFSYGYFWHIGSTILFLIVFIWFGHLLYRLLTKTENQTLKKSVITNHVISTKTEHCPSCGKITETNWIICPYCKSNLK